jgi:hypothetical protein
MNSMLIWFQLLRADDYRKAKLIFVSIKDVDSQNTKDDTLTYFIKFLAISFIELIC